MNKILQTFLDAVNKELEGVKIHLDKPVRAGGTWFIDVKWGDKMATVEWRPEKGFGITCNPDVVFGEGPHEVIVDAEAAGKRTAEILYKGETTHGK